MQRTDYFQTLPNEMLIVIFSNLNPEQIVSFISVHEQFHKEFHQPYRIDSAYNFLWEEKLKKHFPHMYNKLKPTYAINWYEAFLHAYEQEYRIYNKKNKTYKPLPTNIKRLFSFVKEGDVANLERNNILKLKDLDLTDINGVSLLDWAIKTGNQSLLNFFYRIAKESKTIIETDKQKRTLLHWAILCHQPASTIDQLIETSADINAKLANGADQQAIHIACMEGQLDIVKLLIQKQPALLDQTDAFGQMPVLWAASCGHTHVVKYLAEKGADLNLQSATTTPDTPGFTPLHWAVKNNHLETVKILIMENAQLDIPSINGSQKQAIHIACLEGHLNIVKLLIEKQPALLNQTDAFGQTPVLWAASRGHTDIVKYLAEKGANLDLQSTNHAHHAPGFTPLHWAVKNGHTKTMRVLLKQNANIDIRNNLHQTPANLAQTKYLKYELKLFDFLAKAKRRKNDDYDTYNILGIQFDLRFFGATSAQAQREAAKALKRVYVNKNIDHKAFTKEEIEKYLTPHKEALNHVKLHKIHEQLQSNLKLR